ncbi:FliM/FliN family flagellar motor switch protein [Schlesneria paludicola]|uniref:FliM/FliN family flagellar motor switch protein n=1 Tax=Schlesneria paludicola TaxID=360056 RepID=UPI00029ABA46|nr:FliM/FliN family flagellar motor switch protein [Schlesneria paludicola]
MTIQPHDFSRPPTLHPVTRQKLVQWLTRANLMLAEVIAAYSPGVQIRLEDCATAWPFDALQSWPEKTVSYRVSLPDVSAMSVIALPGPLAQVLIGGLLGEQLVEWPQERDLTPGEQSIGEFVISSITSCMNEAWEGDQVNDLQVVEREPNLRRTRIFRFREPFIVCRSTITTSLGAAQWSWILPHEFLSKLFANIRPSESLKAPAERQQLETLAKDMTTQVTVRLGTVQLTAPQLAGLQVGDLVLLNQKTTEPLKAMIAGKPRYFGWPGRVGNRQAFEIASEGGRRDRSAETAHEAGVTVGQ